MRETHVVLDLVDADGGEGVHLWRGEVGGGVGTDVEGPAIEAGGREAEGGGWPVGAAVEEGGVAVFHGRVGKLGGHEGDGMFVGWKELLDGFDIWICAVGGGEYGRGRWNRCG